MTICMKVINKCEWIYRAIRLSKLQKKYEFSKWHMIPFSYKQYAKDIVAYINKCNRIYKRNTCNVVECGCGLCDILKRIKTKGRKIGVDQSEMVCNACRELYSNKTIEIINGSFDDIKNLEIEWFIAVNFVHNIATEIVREYFLELVQKNKIYNFVVDEVNGEDYLYTHNYDEIIPSKYKLKEKLGPYEVKGGKRVINIYTLSC